MPTSMNLIASMYLSSPSLPTGAFAYSQGLESAIERGLVVCKESLLEWCDDALRFGLAKLDLPMLYRLYGAVRDSNLTDFERLNTQVLAMRECKELWQEELHLGQSLKRLVKTQESHFTLGPIEGFLETNSLSYLGAFAVAAVGLNLDSDEALSAFTWGWLDNQVSVSCKAIPLGQTDAQHVLLSLKEAIIEVISAVPQLKEISGSLPGLALLSALHEDQYSRLFRS